MSIAPLPPRLARLPELARDLSWTWTATRDVFRRLDYALWRESNHNPVIMLRQIAPAALERAVADPTFLAMYDAAVSARDAARAPGSNARTWWQAHVGSDAREVVAYFCAEFALHTSLPIYAGGLGVAGGRSLPGGERPRRPARRRRIHVPAGLLPPAHLGGRLAAGSVRADQLGRRADRARADARRSSRASSSSRSARGRCSSRCGRCGSAACGCCSSIPISRKTNRGTASSRRGCTAADRTCVCSRKSSSASAASSRSGRSDSSPRSGT